MIRLVAWSTAVLSTAGVLGTLPEAAAHQHSPGLSEKTEVTREAVVVDDLSGDGLPDVVRRSVQEGERRLTGHTGATGDVVWAVGTGLPADASPDGLEGAILPIGDVDGDGLVDILATAVVTTRGADGTEPPVTDRAFTWHVQVRSGRDGRLLWTRSFAGERRMPGGDGSVRLGINETLPVQSTPDVDGDDVPDVLIQLTSVRTETTFAQEVRDDGTVEQVTTTNGEASGQVLLVAGDDGAGIASVEQPAGSDVLEGTVVLGPDGPALLTSLDRLETGTTTLTRTPDGQEAVVEELSEPRVQLAWRGLPDLAVEWQVDLPDLSAQIDVPGDLTGDGLADVLVQGQRRGQEPDPGEARVVVLTVLGGRDGSVMWSKREVYDAVLRPVPLQADGALDLLASRSGLIGGAGTRTVLVRQDGATGDVLGSTVIDRPEGGSAQLQAIGDADGDGSTDVLYSNGITAQVESGRTGRVIADVPIDRPDERYMPAGDLDGDGRSDVVAVAFEGGPARLRAARGVDGEVLWTQVLDDRLHGLDAVLGVADVDGDDGDDLLLSTLYRIGDGGGAAPVTQLIDGTDGATRWRAPGPPTTRRLAGATRIGTAVAISQSLWASADTVVIARADRFPDALAGGPLAGALDAPILLTPSTHLDHTVAEEIDRLGTSRAVLLGGDQAIAPAVAGELEAMGLVVERLSGPERFSTAAVIADRVMAEVGQPSAITLASGGSGDDDAGWTDAIIGSAFAANTAQPLLLVAPDRLPEQTAAVLGGLQAVEVAIVIGDETAIHHATETRIAEAAGVGTVRMAAATPQETSALVARQVPRYRGGTLGSAWIATDQRFPDALAATAGIAATDGVLLLVGPDPAGNQPTAAVLREQQYAYESVVIAGGTAAISTDVAAALSAIVGASPPD